MSAPPLEPQRLPNGLLWLARPVPGTQVAVRVVYRCGGRDDPTGRSGLSTTSCAGPKISTTKR